MLLTLQSMPQFDYLHGMTASGESKCFFLNDFELEWLHIRTSNHCMMQMNATLSPCLGGGGGGFFGGGGGGLLGGGGGAFLHAEV